MDNNHFKDQKEKFSKGGAAPEPSAGRKAAPQSSGGFDEEKEWMNNKIEELQE